MIRYACPSCEAVFTATDDKGGKTGTCSKCQTQFIVPDAVAPPPPPKPVSGAAPVAKVIRSEPPPVERKKSLLNDDDEERPRRSRLRDDDEDRPRRSRRDDDDDDRPRRKPSSRVQDDDDDDRPRRRSRRDDDNDDDYDRPRKIKKSKPKSGMILACGIICLVAAVGMLIEDIITIDNLRMFSGGGSRRGMSSGPTQLEIVFICFQIAVYGTLVTAVILIAGGIGLILYQNWGRITTLVGAGFSAFMILNIVIWGLLLITYSPPGSNRGLEVRTWDVFRYLLRLVVHVVPVIFVAITLFNIRHTKSLR
ncbi:hypothetical protein BH11PLA2_BH11PLA2_04080 [soil metagenome]